MTPDELLFAQTHEWVRLEPGAGGMKVATIGLSAFALEALTDLVHIELPEVGRQLTVGESLGEVESVKAVSDIYSPLEGEVVEVNSDIAQHLERLAADPYGAGWLVKLRITNESGLKSLLDRTAYEKLCAEEA